MSIVRIEGHAKVSLVLFLRLFIYRNSYIFHKLNLIYLGLINLFKQAPTYKGVTSPKYLNFAIALFLPLRLIVVRYLTYRYLYFTKVVQYRCLVLPKGIEPSSYKLWACCFTFKLRELNNSKDLCLLLFLSFKRAFI